MTCKEAFSVLADFLEQTLSSEAGCDLEEHLHEPCRAYPGAMTPGPRHHVRAPAPLAQPDPGGRFRQGGETPLRENGAGIGASHQTGWTGLVAKLLQQSGE